MYASSTHCTNKGQLSFPDAFYYNIITLTSLGYGDIYPVGFGRIIAAIEVLIGVMLIAFFVGKLASERQAALLLLVYTSEQQRRISEFAINLKEQLKLIQLAIDEKENESLQKLSIQNYNFISSICSYLILHAFQGEIASFGNISSLRKLYKEFNTIQKTAFQAMQIYGLSKRTTSRLGNIIGKLSDTAKRMRQFHKDDQIALRILDNIAQNGVNLLEWNNNVANGKIILRSETKVTDTLLLKVKSSVIEQVWERNMHKKIAKELAISNKLADKCIRILNEKGEITIPTVREQ
jgi:hypothetical protein